jgi:hypothetical protein
MIVSSIAKLNRFNISSVHVSKRTNDIQTIYTVGSFVLHDNKLTPTIYSCVCVCVCVCVYEYVGVTHIKYIIPIIYTCIEQKNNIKNNDSKNNTTH